MARLPQGVWKQENQHPTSVWCVCVCVFRFYYIILQLCYLFFPFYIIGRSELTERRTGHENEVIKRDCGCVCVSVCVCVWEREDVSLSWYSHWDSFTLITMRGVSGVSFELLLSMKTYTTHTHARSATGTN